MLFTYYNCSNLKGSPVCGENVVCMDSTYLSCYNLTGSPACGDKVQTLFAAYANCYNLTGSPVCGPNVTMMYQCYDNCYRLSGVPVFGNNVKNIGCAYRNCTNLSGGNIYIQSNNISYVLNCFYGKNNSRKYNIHVPANSTTFNTMIINNSKSLVGTAITWTNNGTCWYNTVYNIYIYPNL